jgi:hypothetical protein
MMSYDEWEDKYETYYNELYENDKDNGFYYENQDLRDLYKEGKNPIQALMELAKWDFLDKFNMHELDDSLIL